MRTQWFGFRAMLVAPGETARCTLRAPVDGLHYAPRTIFVPAPVAALVDIESVNFLVDGKHCSVGAREVTTPGIRYHLDVAGPVAAGADMCVVAKTRDDNRAPRNFMCSVLADAWDPRRYTVIHVSSEEKVAGGCEQVIHVPLGDRAPFRPRRMSFDLWVAPFFCVTSIRADDVEEIAGADISIPAEAFTVEIHQHVRFGDVRSHMDFGVHNLTTEACRCRFRIGGPAITSGTTPGAN